MKVAVILASPNPLAKSPTLQAPPTLQRQLALIPLAFTFATRSALKTHLKRPDGLWRYLWFCAMDLRSIKDQGIYKMQYLPIKQRDPLSEDSSGS